MNSEKSHLVSLLSVIYKGAISMQRELVGQEEHPLTKPGRKDKSWVNMIPSCLNAEYLQQSCTFHEGDRALNRCWSHCRSSGQPSFVVGMLVSEGGAFVKDLLKNVKEN